MKVLATCLSLVVVILIGLFSWKWRDYGLFHRLHFENVQPIRMAIDRFYEDESRTPESLEELVKMGYLPEMLANYRSFLRHKSSEVSAVNYKDIEYVLIFNEDGSNRCYAYFPKHHLSRYWISPVRKENGLKLRTFRHVDEES